MKHVITWISALSLSLALVGCNSETTTGPETKAPKADSGNAFGAGAKYEVLGLMTDQVDKSKARANVEDTISKHGDVNCLVGLWEYNPPAILGALEDAGKVGEIKVVGFDENYKTLQEIDKGNVQGTVCQQPFQFGYQSIELLRKLVVEKKSPADAGIPDDKLIFIDTITVENGGGADYIATCDEYKAKAKAAEAKLAADTGTTKKVKLAFVTNGSADFWVYAEAGVRQAEADFGDVEVYWRVADGKPSTQRSMVEDLMSKGIQGLAISPINPNSQKDMINGWCDAMPVICCDSDAAESKRVTYLGTDNVAAGRKVGELVKDALPDGGKIMVYVGIADVANAQERFQGMREVLEEANAAATKTTGPVQAAGDLKDAVEQKSDAALKAVEDAGK